MATVEYRGLLIEDAEALGDILGATWHADEGAGSCDESAAAPAAKPSEADAGAVVRLRGLVDVAQCAQRHTFAQVAVMDGKPVGLVLARAGQPSDATAAQWQAVADDGRRRLAALGDNLEDFDAFFSAMSETDARLLAESGCDERFELVLFIVGPETRGFGVGSKLLAAAQEYLREQGAKQAFLFTDTDCSWEYYEHRGMRRAAECARGGNELLPEGLFVYEMEL